MSENFGNVEEYYKLWKAERELRILRDAEMSQLKADKLALTEQRNFWATLSIVSAGIIVFLVMQ